MGGKNESKTTQASLSPQEIEFNNKQLDLASQQLEIVKQQAAGQADFMTRINPLLDLQTKLYTQEFEDMNDPVSKEVKALSQKYGLDVLKQNITNLPLQQELLQSQIDEVRRGGAATPQQEELINEYADEAINSGNIDIERYRTQGLDALRNQLAPALGLRPGDTPVLDRGALLASEALRQGGQLSSGIRGAAANAKLNYPLAASQLTSAIAQGQQGLLRAAGDFQAQLREQAGLNRLRLGEPISGLAQMGLSGGIGLASASAPSGLLRQQLLQSSVQKQGIMSSISGALGGLGGLGIGLDKVGLSSRVIKNDFGAIDPETALAAIAKMPVHVWKYHGDTETHIGPFAEDFADAIGIGDGMTISFIDAIGLLIAAVQALSDRSKAYAH